MGLDALSSSILKWRKEFLGHSEGFSLTDNSKVSERGSLTRISIKFLKSPSLCYPGFFQLGKIDDDDGVVSGSDDVTRSWIRGRCFPHLFR